MRCAFFPTVALAALLHSLGHAKAGKLRVLRVTGSKPISAWPDINVW
jgi:hypothetical protein